MIEGDRWQEVNSLEDLTAAIELYNTLIGLGRYDEAAGLFYERLSSATLYRLGANRQRAELLELLFPDGFDQSPRLRKPGDQAYVLNDLAISVSNSGQPGRAAALFRRDIDIREKEGDQDNVAISLGNLSNVLRFSGALRESEAAARRALLLSRQLSDQDNEARSLDWLGLALAAQGKELESAKALDRSLALALQGTAYKPYDDQTMRALWFGEYTSAQELANQAMTYAQERRFELGVIQAARLQGEAALGLGDVSTAEERLHHALTRARTVNLVEEELPALVGLAELRRGQSDLKAARELLDDAWELAERGPFRLFHADAYNVLAQIERDAGDREAAIKAATAAYRLAWCDGPPFAYHWGLQTAKAHLAALGVQEPTMLPFDESKYEPMPQVEIEPPGEEKAEDQGL